MKNLTHLHAIEAYSITNTKGSKFLKLRSARYNDTIKISWDWNTTDMDSLKENAIIALEGLGYKLESWALGKDSYIFLSSTFEPLK